jgi:glucose/arabinose dehydrogenase
MDVIVHPDFKTNGWIYLTSARPVAEGDGKPVTHVQIIRGRIKDNRWIDSHVVLEFTAEKTNALRMAFDAQRHLYIGTPFDDHAFPGSAADNAASPPQDLFSAWGKVLRLNDDGSVPADNPFAGKAGAYPYVWTYGNRAPLGLAFNDRGELWESEDGPRGGDEVNHLRAGRNYGWPVVTWGHRYDAKAESSNTGQKDMEPPVLAITPSPAVSAIAFYDGKAFPRWKGSLLMGSLKQRDLFRLVLDGDRVTSEEVILHDFDRIRDVAVGPDGYVYLLTDTGLFARLVPAKGAGAR